MRIYVLGTLQMVLENTILIKWGHSLIYTSLRVWDFEFYMFDKIWPNRCNSKLTLLYQYISDETEAEGADLETSQPLEWD